jgi:5-methylcytosine-specific restriction enzyme subunit McrC
MEQRKFTVYEDRYTQVNFTKEEQRELLSLEPIWGKQNIILRADNRLLLKRYVGFVSTRHMQLEILPKVFQENRQLEENEKKQAIQLLFRLLSFSNFINIKEIPDPQMQSSNINDLLEIFISIFINRLNRMLSHHVHRQYENIEENLQFIKGKILFQQSLVKNSGFKHLHYVRYEEFTENTLLNQIFKAIVTKLLAATMNKDTYNQLQLALLHLQNVNTIRLTSSHFKAVRFNRLNEDYRPIFSLAKMFYYNHQPGLRMGDDQTFTFLVPLNELFEYALYKHLKLVYQSENYNVSYQKPQIFLDPYHKKFKLKPDIVIKKDNNVICIVDAKYKNPIIQSEVKVSQADIYQVTAYALRYQCKRVFLIYPLFKGNEDFDTLLAEYKIPHETGDITISIIQIDLNLNNEEIRQGLKEQMDI